MITARHLSQILEPDLRPKANSKKRRLVNLIAIRLIWIICWLLIVAGSLCALGALSRFLWESFLRGWQAL